MSRLYIDKMKLDYDSLLGPAPRLLIWLHGCKKKCPGCIAVDWNNSESAQYSLSVPTLLKLINNNKEIEGITISGGEPFLQADALCELVGAVNKGIIIYTGYTLNELEKINFSLNHRIITSIDALIDGEYIEELNDDKPFRGSSNQKIHLFTDRYKDYYSNLAPRKTINEKKDGFLYLFGIPDKETTTKWLIQKKAIHKGGIL